MSATNQNQKNDSFRVNYNEETHELQLEWDPNDPQWNWLSSLTEEDISNMLKNHLNKLEEQDGTIATS